MPKQATINIPVETSQDVDVERTIQRFFVNKDGNVIVQIVNVPNESGIGKEAGEATIYKIPVSELQDSVTTGNITIFEEIQTILWDKIEEIDAMDEANKATYILENTNRPRFNSDRILRSLDRV